MTDKQPEALRQAAWLKKEGASCQRHYDLGVLIERQHTELETLRAKLKTYEDLGNARSDVQLLRMGYAAARLEIESLKAQLHAAKQINAAQFGLLAASIPGSALRASHGQAPAKPDPAYSEACNLATALFKKHFAHLPDFASGQAVWSLCDSTAGVISQIDNMVSGLVQPPTCTDHHEQDNR